MTPYATAAAGFLVAVLWFDLMHDVQVLGRGRDILPEPVLSSITGYYGRVTVGARPMNRLVAIVMLATVAFVATEIATGQVPQWVGWSSLASILPPVLLAGLRTVPNAVRLGRRSDSRDVQSGLARSICIDHLFCLTAVTSLLVIQLAFGR